MDVSLTRRSLVLGVAAAALLGVAARAETPIDLEWADLIPRDAGLDFGALRSMGVVQHGEITTPFDQEAASAVTTDYDGKIVRIPGFVVPLEYDGVAVKSFLLVPYVGACIHVPPPPANQLIFVTAEAPYEVTGLFEPVYVTGMFGTAAATTQLAEVGYALSAERIEPYE
ncbi:MAG TPA: DUF3299 domain-containing protein [Paracoccaceae bacterium]|nr:DUF3299 domain-containing protein [Paracoccaceae bacterium]